MLFCQRDSLLARRLQNMPFHVDDRLNLHEFAPHYVLRNLRHLKRALSDFSPDVLNPQCSPGHVHFALLRHSIPTTPLLIRTISEPRYPNAHYLNRQLYLRRTDGLIFVNSRSEAAFHSRFGGDRSRLKIVLPGFAVERFAHAAKPGGFRERYGLSADTILCGIVARMSPEKGQEVFVHAVEHLPAALRARLFCICAGEDSKERGQFELRKLVESKGLAGKFGFPGRLGDVRPLLSELDIGVITSTRSEAICRIALEYLSYGIPVIASDVNILPEVILQGRTGWVYRNQDARALGACLQEAIENSHLRRERGAAGGADVRDRLTLRKQVDDTVGFFGRIGARRS